MNESDIQQDLRSASVTPRNKLSPRFSAQVLKKAQLMRDEARIHWRLLTLATFIAVGIAIFISRASSPPLQSSPPSIPVFEADATMFSTLSSDT